MPILRTLYDGVQIGTIENSVDMNCTPLWQVKASLLGIGGIVDITETGSSLVANKLRVRLFVLCGIRCHAFAVYPL